MTNSDTTQKAIKEAVKETVTLEDFTKLDLRVGTIKTAELNEKARKPAYKLTIDFGELGIKQSSAQLTENYSPDDLVEKQIIAVVNFPSMKVAGYKSEVLVLAVVGDNSGTVLLSLDANHADKVINGQAVA